MSANFDHLKEISPELHRLAVLSERFFAEDANTSLIKSRQFGEYMVKEIAAYSGVYDPDRREATFDLLRRLRAAQIVPRKIGDIFHAIRKSGNVANHDFGGTTAEALAGIKFCWTLGVWYRRTYGGDTQFKPGPFVPPKPSKDADDSTIRELDKLRRQVRDSEERLRELEASAEDLAKARAAAEELARQASEESAVWEQTAIELEANQIELKRRLSKIQAAAEARPEQQLLEFKRAGFEAASRVELDEQQTRLLIDVQLSEMGWDVDSDVMRHSNGTRPEDGRAMAIAEWPCEGGSVDYALFVGMVCIGVVEAKRGSVDVPSTLVQAERYARTIFLRRSSKAWTGYGSTDSMSRSAFLLSSRLTAAPLSDSG